MRIPHLATAAIAVAALLSLSACAGSSEGPVIAPVTLDVGELEGTSVDLVVGQVLNIDTGDLAPESYSGTVADSAVAEFVAGKDDGSATFNPGVKALGAGTTEVVLSNTDGGIEDVTFTVEVSE